MRDAEVVRKDGVDDVRMATEELPLTPWHRRTPSGQRLVKYLTSFTNMILTSNCEKGIGSSEGNSIMNMKQRIALLGGGLLLSAIPSMAFAADSTATAAINATVLTPIAISKTADLNFGSFAADTETAGTVVIAAAGTRTFTGGASAVSTGTGTVAAASFNVTGEGTASFSVTLPSSAVTLTHTNTTTTMSVGTFVSNPSGTGALVAGAKTVTVGATLTVAAAQLAGVYANASGLPVTVAYN